MHKRAIRLRRIPNGPAATPSPTHQRKAPSGKLHKLQHISKSMSSLDRKQSHFHLKSDCLTPIDAYINERKLLIARDIPFRHMLRNPNLVLILPRTSTSPIHHYLDTEMDSLLMEIDNISSSCLKPQTKLYPQKDSSPVKSNPDSLNRSKSPFSIIKRSSSVHRKEKLHGSDVSSIESKSNKGSKKSIRVNWKPVKREDLNRAMTPYGRLPHDPIDRKHGILLDYIDELEKIKRLKRSIKLEKLDNFPSHKLQITPETNLSSIKSSLYMSKSRNFLTPQYTAKSVNRPEIVKHPARGATQAEQVTKPGSDRAMV